MANGERTATVLRWWQSIAALLIVAALTYIGHLIVGGHDGIIQLQDGVHQILTELQDHETRLRAVEKAVDRESAPP